MTAPTMRRKARAPRLSPAQRAELRAELEQELHRLIGGRSATPEPGRLGEVVAGLAPHGRRRALQLVDTLRRMDGGEFGVCVSCRAPITHERLLAIPETTACAPCSWTRETAFRR